MTLDRASRVAAVLSAVVLAAGWFSWDSVAVGAERLLPLFIGFSAAILPQLGRVPARVLSALVAAALGLVAAWHGEWRSGPKVSGTGPDIVLVTLDTFRGDRIGPLTPNLARIAASGARFDDAEAAAPLTAPSHASLLTGVDPLEHGLRGNGGRLDRPTIVPRLRDAGYATGAFLSARVLDRGAGLDGGFGHYDDRLGLWARLGAASPRERPGDVTVDRAIAWMNARSEPRFLWVHLYDAHLPYEAPAPFAPPEAEILAARQRSGRPDPTHPGLAQLAEGILRYDGEIRWVDHLVGRLADAVPPDAVLVIVGDHGEGLGENRYAFNHGARLDRAALRVPLIVRWPARFPPGTIVGAPTATTAVAGTLLAAAGLGAGGLGVEFLPLRSATPGQQNRRSELRPSPFAALRDDGGRLVVSPTGGSWADLAVDPWEEHAGSVPANLDSTATTLREAMGRTSPADEDERARLEALGYVE